MPLHITRGKVTEMKVDAIIIAVNKKMLSKGSADGVIKSGIANLGKNLEHFEKGEAIIVPASNLPCKKVIYIPGTEWKDGKSGERTAFRSGLRKCLNLAIKENLGSVAISVASAEACGYPVDKALKEAEDVAKKVLEKSEITVHLVASENTDYNVSAKTIRSIREYIKAYYNRGKSRTGAIKSDSTPTTFEFAIYSRLPGRDDVHCRAKSTKEPGVSKRTPSSALFGSSIGKNGIKIANYKPSVDTENIIFEVGGIDKSFAEILFEYIDKKGMTDVQAYKGANVSRKVFSKLRCDKNYNPSKATAVSFAISLHLSLEDTRRLLSAAGYSLSRSFLTDVIIEYFLASGKYKDIHEVNKVLDDFDQPSLGCSR